MAQKGKLKMGKGAVVSWFSKFIHLSYSDALALDNSAQTKEYINSDAYQSLWAMELKKDAQSKGCKIVDGLGMVINQAVLGIKYWTGEVVDPAVMRKKLLEVL